MRARSHFLLAAAAAFSALPLLSVVTSTARADFPQGDIVLTMPDPASFTVNEVNGGPAGTNWYDTFNPPPFNARFDYGGATTLANHNIAWSNVESTFSNTPGSGSIRYQQLINHAADGDNSSTLELDICFSGHTFDRLQFDIMVDPNSVPDAFGGYGYFQVFSKNTDSYQQRSIGGIGDELANTDYFAGSVYPGSSADPHDAGTGQWMHYDVPLTTTPIGTGVNSRGVLFQLYSDTGRNMNGNVIYYIDNVNLTAVPEPATFAVLALAAVPGVLRRRRHSA